MNQLDRTVFVPAATQSIYDRPVIYVVAGDMQLLNAVSGIALTMGYILSPFEDVNSFVELFDRDLPGCTVVGSTRDPSLSIDCLRRLREKFGDAQVILMSDVWQVPHVVHAIRLGAAEIVDSKSGREPLCKAIQTAVAMDRDARRQNQNRIPSVLANRLTSQEASIFSLMVQGRTTKQIGAVLDLSVRTIHYRKKELFQKLGVKNRSDAIELVRTVSQSDFLKIS